MKRLTRNRVLASVLSLLMALSLVVAVPKFNANTDVAKASAQTQTTEYGLRDNSQDGVILHAWNWSYKTIQSHLQDIAEAGYTTIQTSPVQQPKDYGATWTDVGGQWWKLYQPLNYQIAKDTWLGSKEDLTSLCQEAQKYGIKIICDIVANHLANNGTAGVMSDKVAGYEPTIYYDQGKYVHPFMYPDDGDGYKVTHGIVSECPDTNTAESYVQQKVADLLKECINCGVSGFRFDAAKHIETEYDNGYGSDFWKNTVDVARDYAKNTKGISLYCYGEVLNTPGAGRSYNSYTGRMSVTDNKTSNGIREDIKYGRVEGACTSYYQTQQDPSKLVLWAESHDTFAGDSTDPYDPQNSKDENMEVINKTWAMVASRAKATSLYLVRASKTANKMGEAATFDYKSKLTSSVNHFHNKFVGAQEWLSHAGSIAMNERYFEKGATNGGAVLVNVNGTNSHVSDIKANVLGNGKYTDQITGNVFTVANGKLSGDIGDTGVAVLVGNPVPPTYDPMNTVNPGSCEFKTETLDINLGLTNATSGTYQIGTNGPVETYTGTKTITIGEDMKDGESKTITVTATDGKTTSDPVTYTYTKKIDVPAETVRLYFSNNRHWDKVYAYYWGGTKTSNTWPGNELTKAYTNEYGEDVYSVDIPNDSKGVIFTNGNGQQTVDILAPFVENTDYYITGGPNNKLTVGSVVVK